jgi:pyrimidine-nucleoside phosphorylase
MAVFFRGMDDAETVALTEEMLRSGATLRWSPETPPKVDKHSTGGIGDKVSLPLAPLLACCDVQVPMISGRGLGPTGGTLDKLESIPGFRTDLNIQEIKQQTESVGCVITGATADLVPADRKLYALRDVTATVSCLPLITASIMSKKLAEGLDALVLDVKFGSGAFMKSLEDARALAQSMVDVGTRLGVKTTALLTDMNQPLGRMVGNAVEVEESLDVLRGEGPDDVRELTLALGADVLVSSGLFDDRESARAKLADVLTSGAAYEKFAAMVSAQGGDLDASRPVAPASTVAARQSGVVQFVEAEALGYAVIELGGGRKVQTDRIDHSVGLEMLARIGDHVDAGQPLMRVFAKPPAFDTVRPMIESAVTIGDESVALPPLIVDRIT